MILIRDYRKRAGLTMKELAARLGVHESAVGLWENGKRKPTYERLLQIAEELNCSVNDLVGYGSEPIESAIPEITMIARAGAKMTPEKRQDMLKLLKLVFPEEFSE